MSRLSTYWTDLPAEEKANTLTHVIPWLATILIAWPLMALAYQSQITNHQLQILGTILFLLGMLLMYASSTLYHFVVHPVHKARLRIFDHISIYVMIAGSYSPICLTVVGGWLGWSLFGFLWACVLAGSVGKFIALGKHPKLSLTLYLMMGWAALLVIVPMWRNMSHVAFAWVFAEGIFYSVGSYFFSKDEQHAFYHAIWHVFIILGSLSHTIALWLILTISPFAV